ncbi:hypothetical protein KY289_008403 [Solanum tuberosum]|nr:hypothetical protein KY289_008403 [Solanum tuberosum]
MNSVSKDLLNSIVYGSSAHAVWDELQERFNKVNRVRIFQLHREITTLSEGTSSTSVYFSKLKELWDEYDMLVPSPRCGCPKSKDYVQHLQDQRDEGERSMSMHNVNDGNGGREPLAMQAGSACGPPHHKPPLVCDHCHMKGHTKSQCWKIIGYPGDKGKKKQGGFRGQPFSNANNAGTCLGCFQ